MSNLKDQLIKLGAKNKSLRPHIRPVLKQITGKEAAGYSVTDFDDVPGQLAHAFQKAEYAKANLEGELNKLIKGMEAGEDPRRLSRRVQQAKGQSGDLKAAATSLHSMLEDLQRSL